MRRYYFLFTITLLAMIVWLAGSCDNQTARQQQKVEWTRVDTLLAKAQRSGSLEQMQTLIDSLEEKGELQPLRADFYRANNYNENSRKVEAEDYCRRVLDAPDAVERDPWGYLLAGRMLANIRFQKRDFDGTIRTVLPLIHMMDTLNMSGMRSYIDLYTLLGHCTLSTNQPTQAAENFEKAYGAMQQLMTEDTTLNAVHTAFVNINSITNDYINLKRWEDAEHWVIRLDSLMPRYQHYDFPENPFFSEMQRGSAILNRAMALLGLGRTKEAAEAYAEFKENSFSITDYGRINASDYLMLDKRYAAAADNYEVVDRVVRSSGYELSLDLINTLYIPKLKANLLSGRKDAALHVASQIAESFDSAYHRQLTDQTAELATIYDTKGKEAQIAHQQAELSQQRFIGVVVALTLITIFFIIYTLHRRRAARRMALMKARQERIESELRIARDIQMSMVPNKFPDEEGLDMYASMKPAKEVGGDLYGYVLQDRKLYFALGDVSGKGVPASLFMAQATRLFRTLAAQGMSPAEICTRMNDALSGEDNKNSMFVTFFLGLVDLETGRLSFCNAGHNPPILNAQYMEMQPNAPIGILSGMQYIGEEMDTIKGCSIFVYSDGLNEAENNQQEQFGDERLLDILRTSKFDSARQVIDTLAAEVEKHRDGAEPNDDLTMMCLRIS